MKSYANIVNKVVGSGLLAIGLVAVAEAQDPYYRNDRNGGYRDGGYANDRNGYSPSGSLIGRVLSDIDRIASNSWVDDHERRHFYEASRKLQEFEERLTRGNFDNGKLDKAIENIQHLADADQVRGRDRDMLYRDLSELRQFRSTRGRYSNDRYQDYRDDRYYRR